MNFLRYLLHSRGHCVSVILFHIVKKTIFADKHIAPLYTHQNPAINMFRDTTTDTSNYIYWFYLKKRNKKIICHHSNFWSSATNSSFKNYYYYLYNYIKCLKNITKKCEKLCGQKRTFSNKSKNICFMKILLLPK